MFAIINSVCTLQVDIILSIVLDLNTVWFNKQCKAPYMGRMSGDICRYKKYQHSASVYVGLSGRSWPFGWLLSDMHAGKPAANRLQLSALSQWQGALIRVYDRWGELQSPMSLCGFQ